MFTKGEMEKDVPVASGTSNGPAGTIAASAEAKPTETKLEHTLTQAYKRREEARELLLKRETEYEKVWSRVREQYQPNSKKRGRPATA